MKVQISIIQRDNVMSKIKEEFAKKNPPLTEEELEDQRAQRIIKGLSEDEEEPKVIIIPEINMDEFSTTVDLHFRLSAVNSIYQTPADEKGRTSMMILINNTEYQAVYQKEQFEQISKYLDLH